MITEEKKGWINPEKNIQGMCIDLGAGNPIEGEYQTPGYVLQDIQQHGNIDLVCDIRDLEQYIKPSSCKSIVMSHICEHFETSYIPTLLKMVYGFLENNGELFCHVPNLKWHCALILEDRDEEAVNYAFGGQRDKYDFHKTGFTPSLLIRRITEAGFTILDLQVEHSLHVLAKK